MPTLGIEIHLTVRERLSLLRSGVLFANVILYPSWFVHLTARRGEAWIEHPFENRPLRQAGAFTVHGDSPGQRNSGGSTLKIGQDG